MRNHENCQFDYWDCLENDEKETIAKQICTLMKECCDFIRFQGTCQDVDFSYSWAWTLQQLKDGLKGTVFENHRKSRIQHCELRSYVYILSGQKLIKNVPKLVHFCKN